MCVCVCVCVCVCGVYIYIYINGLFNCLRICTCVATDIFLWLVKISGLTFCDLYSDTLTTLLSVIDRLCSNELINTKCIRQDLYETILRACA